MTNTTAPTPPSPPLKQLSFAFPFRRKAQGATGSSADLTDEHEFYKLLSDEPSGTYSVSAKGTWHGGIHVTEAGAGSSLDLKHGVRCIADGEVVAYRVNRTYPVSELPAQGGTAAISAPYSTGFALVRHSMEFPRGTTQALFSLYMHLSDLADYESDQTLSRPAYWSKEFKVTEFAQDQQRTGPNGQTAPAGEIGLRIRATKKTGTILGILPQGAQIVIGARDGNWGRIKDTRGATLYPPIAGGFVSADSAVNGWIFMGTENGGAVVAEVIPDSSLDRVIVLPEAMKIKAGDLIGHLGRYDSLSEQTASRMVHIEVFCDDSIKTFITQGRAWIAANGAHEQAWQELGLPKDPTILRIDQSTTLYAAMSQPGENPKQTGVIQVSSLAELARQTGNPSKETAAGTDGQKLNWWRVGSANALGNEISGWVREQNFAGGRVTREFAQKWVDFQAFEDLHDPTHTMFATTEKYVDYALGAAVPDAGSFDKLSPLMQQIYEALPLTGERNQAADRLRDVSNHPWSALRLSRLIIRHESEWANPGKWKQLVAEIEKQTGPLPQHAAEQERIEKLVWWDDAKAGLAELPAPDVFHINPVALVGNFSRKGCSCGIPITKELFRTILPNDVLQHGLFYKAYCESVRNFSSDAFLSILNRNVLKYGISNCIHKVYFLSQVAHECDQLRTNEEYRNHDGTIPAGWNNYHGGSNFHGRGLIQITHDNGYKHYGTAVGDGGIATDPDIVSRHIEHTVESACWYWRNGSTWGDLNPKAERSDFLSVTIGVNGGYRHVIERNKLLMQLAVLINLDECRNATNIKLKDFTFAESEVHASTWYSHHLTQAANVEGSISNL
jgi:predicted chitinase